jgi:hypothetical protein
MTSTKYIGLDVHTESISMAVRNAAGKIVMESVIETKASTILQSIHGLQGDLQVTFEEGTWAAWLYDLLRPHVSSLVCDPRRNALLKDGDGSRASLSWLVRRCVPRHPVSYATLARFSHCSEGIRQTRASSQLPRIQNKFA